MGSMCSTCSDTSQAENAQKQRQTLLPEKQQDAISDIEGRPSNSNFSEGDAQPKSSTTDLSKFDNLFEDLAKFIKQLPAKSKKHIWEHAVIDKDKKIKKVYDKTFEQEHITKLLCDCVIVYVKYLNRKEKPLKTQAVLPYVEPAAQWIFDNYGDLERQRFEQESTYFADMLEEYQHFVK